MFGITMQKVKGSSNVKGMGYKNETETLQVEYLNGSTYQFFKVQVETWEALQKADSIGKFLHQHVKFQYEFEKMPIYKKEE